MSIWAEIKKAVNSTVGTQNFKPLDELYRDSRYVYASDNVILDLHNPDSSYYMRSFKVNIPGTYKIKVHFLKETKTSSIFSNNIYQNGSKVAEISFSTSTAQETEGFKYLTFSAGDVITFERGHYQSKSLSSDICVLCGMIGAGGAPAEVYTE